MYEDFDIIVLVTLLNVSFPNLQKFFIFYLRSVYEDTVIGHFFPTWSEYYYYVLTLQDYKLKTCRRTQSISVSNRMSPTSKHKEIRNELACLFPENRSTHSEYL